jgi:DNA-binding XRE family transcriptional regulator
MDANELKQHRAALGLTGDQLSQRLGVNPRTARRWESGAVPVPPVVALAVRLLRLVPVEDWPDHG